MPSRFPDRNARGVSRVGGVVALFFGLLILVALIVFLTKPQAGRVQVAERVPEVFDPRLLRLDPWEWARIPEETEFQSPMGTAAGAFVYDAQPFLTMNSQRGGRHTGADLNGIGGWNSDRGSPVHASGTGLTVFSANVGGGWGETVILAHRVPGVNGERVILTMSSHLHRRDVAVGDLVARGEKIGEVGDGGGVYLAHLHFEVRDLGTPHPSFGYSGDDGWDTLSRLNPDTFLREHAPSGEPRPIPSVSMANRGLPVKLPPGGVR